MNKFGPIKPDAAGFTSLHDALATRQLEAAALARQREPGQLMAQAGLSVARLAMALAPHAREITVLVGPGNNGGDGLIAARHLHEAGRRVIAIQVAPQPLVPAAPALAPGALGQDTALALAQATQAGVAILSAEQFLAEVELGLQAEPSLIIDALLGLGQRREPAPLMTALLRWAKQQCQAYKLAIDLPTGLCPDTGRWLGEWAFEADATLSLLTLKPGLYTGLGRDTAGEIWLEPLGLSLATLDDSRTAQLGSATLARCQWPARRHAQHKGSFGDLWILAGAPGMTGAAWLAAQAGLEAGAGRVYVAPLGDQTTPCPATEPALMVRPAEAWQQAGILEAATVVCGCGGGAEVAPILPEVLLRAGQLILDADALNAIAADAPLLAALQARAQRGQASVLTPHPLEAARLLACSAAEVQANRPWAVKALAQKTGCVVLLKGSGTLIASPGGLPWINPTGNARLATPGSGDVLAGWLGGAWCSLAWAGETSWAQATERAEKMAASAAWIHGAASQTMPPPARRPLTASRLIEAAGQQLDQL